MPSPSPTTGKAEPRAVHLVILYASQRTTRTGRRYPVGTHVRAEIRDAKDGTILATHASSPFSTQRLRWESEKRGERIVRRVWDIAHDGAVMQELDTAQTNGDERTRINGNQAEASASSHCRQIEV